MCGEPSSEDESLQSVTKPRNGLIEYKAQDEQFDR